MQRHKGWGGGDPLHGVLTATARALVFTLSALGATGGL